MTSRSRRTSREAWAFPIESAEQTAMPPDAERMREGRIRRGARRRGENMTSPILYFNGIDADSGHYVLAPATPEQMAASIRRGAMAAENLVDARSWLGQGSRALRSGDPRDLAQAGWGVIFAQKDPQAADVYTALQPLLELRRSQAGGRHEHYYREYRGDRGFREGDTKRRFLSRHGVGPGAADPDRMPYYLLLVGDPEAIPYEFQYQLDMQYAVGRLWFETVDQYAKYAMQVVAAEAKARSGVRSAVFFAPLHPEDHGTELSATHLTMPLIARAEKTAGWSVRPFVGEDATKARLQSLLGGKEAPDLLFTAGHGMVVRSGHHLQPSIQGAVMCQDWPGPTRWKGGIPPDFYFGGDDLGDSARAPGLVSFQFACYSAGGPAWDDFSTSQERLPVAPKPFISRLPLRLLQAGALAVIGHVERAWFCSMEWPGAGVFIQPFEDSLDKLLAGYPVGAAMEPFGQRYAELGADLSSELEEIMRGGPKNDALLTELWTNSHDARNYVVLGDPAVRLPSPEVKS
jgi:hypothetical protein